MGFRLRTSLSPGSGLLRFHLSCLCLSISQLVARQGFEEFHPVLCESRSTKTLRERSCRVIGLCHRLASDWSVACPSHWAFHVVGTRGKRVRDEKMVTKGTKGLKSPGWGRRSQPTILASRKSLAGSATPPSPESTRTGFIRGQKGAAL